MARSLPEARLFLCIVDASTGATRVNDGWTLVNIEEVIFCTRMILYGNKPNIVERVESSEMDSHSLVVIETIMGNVWVMGKLRK